MVISILFVIFLITLWNRTLSNKRKAAVVIAFFLYLCVTIMDFAFLENVLNRFFHFSDPSVYYEETKKFVSIKDILYFEEKTNIFYLAVNYYYNHIYDNPYDISFWIKINNILVILTAYLLLTRKQLTFSMLDVFLLFNPYLIVTITRNVRDAYIILFVAMIILGFKYNSRNKCGLLILFSGILLLLMTRPILLVPFVMILLYRITKKKPIYKYPIIALSVGVFYIFFYTIVDIIVMQSISAMEYVDEDTTKLASLLDHQYSLSTFLILIKRILIGLASFLFTPHPINYYENWVTKSDLFGTLGIYTGFDNFLIFLGAIYSYIFIIPLSLYYFSHYKKYGDQLFLYIVLYIIIYTIAYMGITDIRNKHFAYFFILIALIYNNFRYKHPIREMGKYYLVTLAIFIGIYFISNN